VTDVDGLMDKIPLCIFRDGGDVGANPTIYILVTT